MRRRLRALLGREPMYRRCDVAHLRATLALTILALLMVPLVVLTVARVQTGSGEAARTRQLAHKQSVSALLPSKPPTAARPGAETVTASVQWVAADGTARTGEAQVPLGVSAGDTTRIWLDAEGRPTTPPPTHGAIVVDAIVAGMLALAASLLVTAGAFGSEQVLISRRRTREWEREWAAVEPKWTGRIEH
ncbi:hypothetical protein [Embleya sp. NPDC059259]|uniref:Rv1733c family protein n=1 Tax=unclassified Embleya TaxID=2699296 RepID=UPI0036C0EDE9